MYPFERFTEASKQALTMAQEESERMRHGYIGTEHLLIALVRQRATVAGEALARLGVAEGDVRERVDEIVGSEVRVVVTQIIPTARAKKVIQMSFREARNATSTMVWTDHILLALMLEGEGVAAHVLDELGPTIDEVRATSATVRANGVDEVEVRLQTAFAGGLPAPSLVGPHIVMKWMRLAAAGARAEAQVDYEDEPDNVHLLRYLLRKPDRRVAQALRRLGIDREALREATRPPDNVLELRRDLRTAVREKRAASARDDYPAAEAALQRERQLREELDAAEAAWRKELDEAED